MRRFSAASAKLGMRTGKKVGEFAQEGEGYVEKDEDDARRER